MDALINIDVPDLERAIRFYEDGLGLRCARRLFSNTAAEMTGASSRIYLLCKAEGSRAVGHTRHSRAYTRHWTPVHLDFVVPDLAAAVTQARKAGAELEHGPEAFTWGHLATLSDPFGNGFCLLQWSGKGYDEAEG